MDARPVLRKAARAEYAVLRAPLALLNHRLGKRLSDESFVRQALQFSLDRMDGIAGRLLKRGTVKPAEAAAGGMNTVVDTAENTDTAESTDLDAADLDAIGVDGTDVDTGDVDIADLEEADLDIADLEGAGLDVADLDVADLNEAGLDVADLDVADLDIADLDIADLDVADLDVPKGTPEPAAGDAVELAAPAADSADLQVTGPADPGSTGSAGSDAGSTVSDAPVVLEQLPTAEYEAATETILSKEEAVPVGELADASEADLEALAALRAKHLLEEREQQRRLEQERDR